MDRTGAYSIGIGPYPCDHHCICFSVNNISGYVVKRVLLTVFPSMDFNDEEFCVDSDGS